MPGVICFAGNPRVWAGGCSGLSCVVWWHSRTLPPCHLIVLSFPGDLGAQQLLVPGGRWWWLCLSGFSCAAPSALTPGGWSQRWKLSYTVAPAPLKYTCLKLRGNGLEKCSWVIKINEAWQDAGSQVRCVCTEQNHCLSVTWASPFLETAPFAAQFLGVMLRAGAVLRQVMVPVTNSFVWVLSKSCARKGEGCYDQQEGPGHKNIYMQHLCTKYVNIDCSFIYI